MIHAINLTPEQVHACVDGRMSMCVLPLREQPPEGWTVYVDTVGGQLFCGSFLPDTDVPVRSYAVPFAPNQVCYGQETFSLKAWNMNEIRRSGLADRFYLDTGEEYYGDTLKVFYRADGEHRHLRWLSSTQMTPKRSRLKITIKTVDVRRVDSITPEEAVAAGYWKASWSVDEDCSELYEAVADAWQSRYGDRHPFDLTWAAFLTWKVEVAK